VDTRSVEVVGAERVRASRLRCPEPWSTMGLHR
jgi:hypothetical protein